jgi:hypothetical protein
VFHMKMPPNPLPRKAAVQAPARATSPRLRKSHIYEREQYGHYVEPSWCSERLFQVEIFSGPILDPFAGFGTIPEAAKAAGHRVFAADIVDRGYPGCRVQDFLKREAVPPSIVGNPDFDYVEDFVRHALATGAEKIALICPVARLNAARWLRELPLKRIWLLSPRPSMPPGSYIAAGGKPKGGRVDFCWLIFERGYRGHPEIHWLHRDDFNSGFTRSRDHRAKKPAARTRGSRPISDRN